ncbi:hypothetical protein E5D57_005912 [Metarhizium anisopliae]|nr:hypothetical protein E5D57_005912 [Metarhizium anisopliae]
MAENLTRPGVIPGIELIEEQGIFIGRGPVLVRFRFQDEKVTLINDGKTRINSAVPLRGLSSASKELPEDETDTSPTLSNWRNKPLFISSSLVSQRGTN